MDFKTIFSSDVNFNEGGLICIEDANRTDWGIYIIEDTDANKVYMYDVELEFPDWVDFKGINSFCDTNYSGKELSGWELFRLLEDSISYHGTDNFDSNPSIYEYEEVSKKFDGLDFEDLTNEQVISLYFGE